MRHPSCDSPGLGGRRLRGREKLSRVEHLDAEEFRNHGVGGL